jgi:hypothetical protein
VGWRRDGVNDWDFRCCSLVHRSFRLGVDFSMIVITWKNEDIPP